MAQILAMAEPKAIITVSGMQRSSVILICNLRTLMVIMFNSLAIVALDLVGRVLLRSRNSLEKYK